MTDAFKAKVLLVGPPGVGKTSLVRRYVLHAFDERYRATLGAIVYKHVTTVDAGDRFAEVNMTIWDTMGEAGLADPLRGLYELGTQGVLAVADVTDARTVASLDPWLTGTLRVAGDVPVHILLNKADAGASGEARAAGLAAGVARGAPVYATSAKTGDNVAAAFADLARRIVERRLVPADGPVDDEDFGIALACGRGRTAEEVAGERGIAVPRTEARIERLLRRGLVRIASLDLDPAGRPRVVYAATQAAFLEPLRAAKR